MTDMGTSIGRRSRRPSPGTLLGTMALIAAVSGAAYAAIPSADGSIKGCYATTDGLLLGIPHAKGDLRAIDGAESCRPYEKPVSWNQKGQKGDLGPTGPQGPAGPAGPAPAGHAAHGTATSKPTDQLVVPASTTVPAGRYLSTATVQSEPTAGLRIDFSTTCDLKHGGQNLQTANEFSIAPPIGGPASSLALSGAFEVATDTLVSVVCQGSTFSSAGVDVDASLVVTKVGSIG